MEIINYVTHSMGRYDKNKNSFLIAITRVLL